MPRFNRMVVNGAISDRNIFRHSVFVQVKCLQATNTKKYLLLKPHRLPLRAIHENRKMRIRFHGHTGVRHSFVCNPYRLEYSEKDDKFRILVTGMRRMNTINMARIRSCELLEEYDPGAVTVPKGRLKALTLLLHDERNGLERVLLHFSHFEKETQKLDERLYRITLRYDQDDETELLIRVLSFGPVLEVVAPITFRQLMRNRIQKQALYAARGFSQ